MPYNLLFNYRSLCVQKFLSTSVSEDFGSKQVTFQSRYSGSSPANPFPINFQIPVQDDEVLFPHPILIVGGRVAACKRFTLNLVWSTCFGINLHLCPYFSWPLPVYNFHYSVPFLNTTAKFHVIAISGADDLCTRKAGQKKINLDVKLVHTIATSHDSSKYPFLNIHGRPQASKHTYRFLTKPLVRQDISSVCGSFHSFRAPFRL